MGACCVIATAACTVTTYPACTGVSSWIPSATCTPTNPCPPANNGACCFSDGTCLVTAELLCAGTHRGAGTTCTTTSCVGPVGACCQPNGSCTQLSAAACTTAGGTFRGVGVDCAPNPCPILTVACCRGATCSITLSAQCTGQFSRAVAARNQCNAGTNATTPCCKADFNKAGGIELIDIYDFLTAWFNASPLADYDGNGAGAPTLNSVLSFLRAWYAGGC
jgi:hypothetical protein